MIFFKNIILIPINIKEIDYFKDIKVSLKKVFPESNILSLNKTLSVPMKFNKNIKNQYNSKQIISFLSSIKEKNDTNIHIGITSEDIYATGLQYVFGEADILKKIAIVSTHRLKNSGHGSSDIKKLIDRTSKVIVHEIGHLLSLKHCNNCKCVMSFSENEHQLDNKNIMYCKKCQKKHDLHY